MATGTRWKVLDDAHEALRDATLGVGAEAWSKPTPCDKWNVTQVLQHAVGDQLGWAAQISGGPGPTENPFAPSGHLDGDPVAFAESGLRAASSAFAGVSAGSTDVPTPLPQGALDAWLAAGACALDAAVHAWDIAVATGQPSPLTPALARSLMPVATALVEPLRAYGVYAEALEPAASDDDVAALLRYLGRQPDWAR